jgi:hypothetical protein
VALDTFMAGCSRIVEIRTPVKVLYEIDCVIFIVENEGICIDGKGAGEIVGEEILKEWDITTYESMPLFLGDATKWAGKEVEFEIILELMTNDCGGKPTFFWADTNTERRE